jgi:predicted nucleic acid-binding OB-fold protein
MSNDDKPKRIFVPKKQPAKQEDKSRYMPSRPAEGRAEPVSRPTKQQPPAQKNQRPQPQGRPAPRQKVRQQSPQQHNRPQQLEDENWAYIVEHEVDEKIMTALSEQKMVLCRLRVKEDCGPCSPMQRINIGKRHQDRQEVQHIVGLANFNRMSSFAVLQLPQVIHHMVSQHAEYFLNAFFNVASNISLKMHAFELLPQIGNKKAMQMVEARGSGFESIETLNKQCNIDAIHLLSQRFLEEIKDQDLQPRLISLLLPVKP